jgi:2-succinyl-5-enolpyruvyl-6-hydroxy-3-cyclohexene-1-carboxylate synthase
MTKYYTDEENAQIVIALLKGHGIRKVVASPGATNIAIVGSIQNDPYFEVYSSADERSAAYLACGLSYESGESVALSCTGATASRNYLPGLTEAWYRKLPIIAITSTPSLVAVGHLLPQCIDRSASQKDIARISVTIPQVKDKEDFWDCEVKVNKAILEARRAGGGPVHINLVTSYKGTFNTRELPPVRVIRRIGYSDEIPTIDPSRKVAVFVGSHKPFNNSETESLEQFVNTHNAVVLCDHTSSYKGAGRILSALACSQDLPTRPNFAALKPDLIIHLGEVSGDYATQGVMVMFGAKVWRVSEDGELRDRFKRLEYVFEMREQDFFQRLSANLIPRENSYLPAWQEYAQHVADMISDLPFSNTWIAREVSRALPPNARVHLSILNTLRNWDFFDVDKTIQTASNVGGFGIDGCVSTLIGASFANSDRLYFGVFGDLAFFYDLNSLGNRHLGSNLRILLINNGGGGEFKMYSHVGAQFGEQTEDYIAAARHYGNKSPTLVKHIAQDLGFKYLCANNKDEFQQVAQEFTTAHAQDKPILLECFTDFSDDSNALEAARKLDTTVSAKSVAVGVAHRVLPQSVQAAIRKALR